MKITALALSALFVFAVSAAENTGILLPKPRRSSGKNIMECLAARQTIRKFSKKELTPLQLSEVLYAACGINRPDKKKLTIPTAMNVQDLTVYAVLPWGIFRYDPARNRLMQTAQGDHRAELGMNKKLHASAPLALIYVSDRSKMKFTSNDAVCKNYAFLHAGLAAQSVGLYCASAELGNVVIGSIDGKACTRILKLKDTETPVIGQLIGFPQ